MKLKRLLILTIIFLFANQVIAGGHLLIIGGGKRPDRVMKKVIELAGGENAKIVVIPMASGDPVDVGDYQANQLRELGSNNCTYILCDSTGANADTTLAKLEGVTGIFLSGGDQNRLTKIFNGSKVLDRLKEIYESGGVIAGTSAGAAVMSKIMITGDEIKYPDARSAFTTIEKDNIKTIEGFGLLQNAIIDQHFIYRKRINRLFSAVLENPKKIGLGIDESTAIIVKPNNTFEVLGDYQVVIIDAKESGKISNNDKGLFSVDGLNLHILLEGEKYNFLTRKVIK